MRGRVAMAHPYPPPSRICPTKLPDTLLAQEKWFPVPEFPQQSWAMMPTGILKLDTRTLGLCIQHFLMQQPAPIEHHELHPSLIPPVRMAQGVSTAWREAAALEEIWAAVVFHL